MLAHKTVISFSADILLVTVPPFHPADVGAEFLFPAAFGLHYRSAAVLADLGSGNAWVAVDMGSDSARRKAQFCGDHGRTVSLQPHIVDGDFILQSHGDTPSVMTAKWWGE